MPYLTYEEYQNIGFSDVAEVDFPKYERKASDVLDSITRDFYQHQDLETDVPLRRNKFKSAIAAQIDYFYDLGGTSSHELNSPLAITIGRTQVSSGADNQKKTNNIVADDVYMYLRSAGLLYGGIGVI